ncbi:hypothetical protein MAUB1S_08879 [Mycolicibacterium aubagnense]
MTKHLPGHHLLHKALGFAAAARHVASMPGCHAGELLLQNLGNAIELSLNRSCRRTAGATIDAGARSATIW